MRTASTALHRHIQREVERAIRELSPPEQAAVLTEVLAGTLADAGVTSRSEAFTAFLSTFLQVLPGRLRTISSERRDASY
jgi:hypothetical protein